MVMRIYCLTLFAAFAVIGCNGTEMPLDHTNPMDRIYDSGSFRQVLTGIETSTTQSVLNWSNVFHKTDGELSDSSLKINGTAAVYLSTVAPSASDLSLVTGGQALSGAFTPVSGCSIAAANASYAGSCPVTTNSGRGYFIIRFNYTYASSGGSATSGIFYSNFVVLQ